MSELGDIFSTTPWLLAACVFLFSLLIGSFLNVVIHRLPIMLDREWKTQARELLSEQDQEPSPGLRPTSPALAGEVEEPSPPGIGGRGGEEERYNLLVPRSRCPHCNAEIKAHQNIPVLSYLLLRGKCANCRSRISPRYPIVELVTALL